MWNLLPADSVRLASSMASRPLPADTADSLADGAAWGALAGGVVGLWFAGGMASLSGRDSSGGEAMIGVVLGAAAGASVGMLIDALLDE